MSTMAGLLVAAASAMVLHRLLDPRRAADRAQLTGRATRRRRVRSKHRAATARRAVLVGAPLVVGVVVLGWLPAAVATGLAASLRPLHRRVRARRAVAERNAAIPEVIELFVLVVRAGFTTRQTLRFLVDQSPAATQPAFEDAVARLDRGAAPADALLALPEHLGRGVEPVVDLIGPADRYGLPLGPTLAQLANEARRSRQRLAEAEARRLPVRLSFPLVACTLPSFVLLAVVPAVLAALSSLGGTAW